ncbi:TRAP transporter large permease [Sedimentitalea sp.]|uniref:TRAP transporter large permease n=1 Tax=Sedimentitalea sp. TaxID=2048915 RepID=UPI0032982552
MIATVIILLMFLLLAAGMPVGFNLITVGTLGIYLIGGTPAVLGVLSSMPRDSASAYEFLSIPMFLLMAEFVLRSGVADDLFQAAAAWFGRIRGGLGVATALAGAGFGAVCGSSTAAAATLSSTSLPAMKKYGYDSSLASGVVAISGTLSMLIPPSIAMIIYALLADVSIAKMLIAGVIPGVIITFTIAVTVYSIAVRNPDMAPLTAKVSFREKIVSLRLIAPMLVLMMAVTGVIYLGVATPTEASAVGALASGVLYFLRKSRSTSLSQIYEIFSKATRTACMLGIIILGAHIFTTFFALTQTTQILIDWIASLPLNRWMIIIYFIIAILVLGCFMDQMAILVLTVPVLAPILQAMDFDLIWFGVILIITAEVGLVTPPMGLNCFVVSKYARVPVGTVFRGTLPHVGAHLVAIIVLVSFPALVLWLPSHVH